MRLSRFIKDKLVFLVVTLVAGLMGAFALYAFGCPPLLIVFTSAVYLLGGAAALLHEYLIKHRYYKNLLANLDGLDKKYYIAEIMDSAPFCEGEILEEILKVSGKSMNDEIAAYARAKRDYREYVEMWVHEIKTPISGARLICENNGYGNLLGELDAIEKYVEQALFYARSEAVEKDYLIREVEIKDLINGIVKKNAGTLIARKIKIEVHGSGTAHTDPKWLEFILQQLMDNSIKYGTKTLVFEFAGHTLTIKDDGIGIPQSDLPRVFELGFTGENGRKTAKSTGIGLYLCKKLCDKMGLVIAAASEEGVTITISFPENFYVTLL